MPGFDLAQDRFEILADRQPAFACNRDRRRRHVVGEFSPRAQSTSRQSGFLFLDRTTRAQQAQRSSGVY